MSFLLFAFLKAEQPCLLHLTLFMSNLTGYLTKCSETSDTKCCPDPWQKGCHDECFTDYNPCDGGRCIPSKSVQYALYGV